MHFAIPSTVLPSLEWEYIWRGGGKEMGERRGCLIYSFHCCRRSSLLFSVREGKWSVHAGKKSSQSHFLSTFLMALFRVCLVLRLLVFPPLLPFPQFVTRSQGNLCSLLASTLQTGETFGSGTEWGGVGVGGLRGSPACVGLFRIRRTA